MPAPDRERGFTLLEVLVAFVIAAGALSALAAGVVTGLRNARAAEQVQVALAVARSRLALATAPDAAVVPAASGIEPGGYRWQLRAEPAASGTPGGPLVSRLDADGRAELRAARLQLVRVSVVVAWDAGGTERQVRLETMRLLAAPEPPP